MPYASGYNPVPAPTNVPDELIQKWWAKELWDAGIDESFWKPFMGHSSKSIIHIREDLRKNAGDTVTIPLRMPLFGAGVVGDNTLEGNEEGLTFRQFKVGIEMIRHAVSLAGEYSEKLSYFNLRKEARNAISDWLSRYIDLAIFAILTGTPFPLIKMPGDVFPFEIEAPSADRVLFANGKTSEQALAATDVFDTNLISLAKRKAIADEITAIRPIKVEGKETYLLVIDHWQSRDLRRDPRWIEAQEHANVRGSSNPIFAGSIGMWDGIVVYENGRVPRTDSGSGSTLGTNGFYTGGTMVGHALLLGAQALTFAEGREPKIVVKKFDYDNIYGVSIGRIFGLKRSRFQYDGVNWIDYGCLNIMTASVED